MAFPTELIPDEDILLRRIPRQFIKGSYISTRAFSFDADGCSVNWAKYSTPEEVRQTEAHPPEYYMVGSLETGKTRQCGLNVQHAPVNDNRSYALIQLPQSNEPEDILEFQVSLTAICAIVLN